MRLWGQGAFQAEGTVDAKVGYYLLSVEQGVQGGTSYHPLMTIRGRCCQNGDNSSRINTYPALIVCL